MVEVIVMQSDEKKRECGEGFDLVGRIGQRRDEATSDEVLVCCSVSGMPDAAAVAFRNKPAIDCVNSSEEDM
jgi:hypothetical protein